MEEAAVRRDGAVTVRWRSRYNQSIEMSNFACTVMFFGFGAALFPRSLPPLALIGLTPAVTEDTGDGWKGKEYD
jgi:hypothetical protein